MAKRWILRKDGVRQRYNVKHPKKWKKGRVYSKRTRAWVHYVKWEVQIKLRSYKMAANGVGKAEILSVRFEVTTLSNQSSLDASGAAWEAVHESFRSHRDPRVRKGLRKLMENEEQVNYGTEKTGRSRGPAYPRVIEGDDWGLIR